MPARMLAALSRHYDAKYTGENVLRGSAAEAPLAEVVRAPADRYEACVRFFPRFFSGGALLELGAGDGRAARSLLAAGLRCESLVISEASESRLTGLRQRFRGDARVQVEALDAEALPESLHGRFEAVIGIALIEHLIDPLRALQRLRGVLRPGGFVYLDTPNAAKLSRRLKLLLGRFPSTASRDEGLTRYDGG